MKRILDLRTPRRSVGSGRFDTRPRAVRKWVKALPLANLNETGMRLLDALGQVNADRSLSCRQLFSFLESVGPFAHLVLADLKRGYAYQPLLPSSASGTRATRLAEELLTQLLRGHRTVLRSVIPDKEEASRWRVFWYRRRLATTLHRFIHWGHHLLGVYHALHMDPPEGAWRRIHRCYRIAEAHGMARSRSARFGEKRPRTSIDLEYKRLLLCSLLPMGGVKQSQEREIEGSLDQWARLLKLRHHSTQAQDAFHLVRLARDVGPLPVAGALTDTLNGRNTLWLDTAALRASLERQRSRKRGGRWWSRLPDLDPESLTFLYHHWCAPCRRSEVRHPVDIPAEVAVGFGAMLRSVGGVAASAEQSSTTIVLGSIEEDDGNWLDRRKEIDIWQSVYVDPTRVKRSIPLIAPAQQERAQECPEVRGRVIDRSRQGMAVVIPRGDLRQSAIGSPVGVRAEGEWSVGFLVRLRDRGDKVELGMRMVLTGAAPVRLRTREGDRLSPSSDVVVGRAPDGRLAIAAPAVGVLRKGEPVVEVGDKSFAVHRGSPIAHSPYFDAYLLELPDAAAIEAIEQASASSNAMGSKGKGHRGGEGISREERIVQVMTEAGLSRSDAEMVVNMDAEADC